MRMGLLSLRPIRGTHCIKNVLQCCLTPLWKASLEGYKRERSLPEDYQRYLTTFDTMHNVAVVNRQLVLLSSEATSS